MLSPLSLHVEVADGDIAPPERVCERVSAHVPASLLFGGVSWVGPADAGGGARFMTFSATLEWGGGDVIFHVTADERFELRVAGRLVAAGPDCGTPERWYYTSHRLWLPPGRSTWVARVGWLGDLAPSAHTTVQPGFLLAAEGAAHRQLSTGVAAWSGMTCPEYEVVPERRLPGAHFIGPSYRLNGSRLGEGRPVRVEVQASAVSQPVNGRLDHRRELCPSELPAQVREVWTTWRARMECPQWLSEAEPVEAAWTRPERLRLAEALAAGRSVVVPAFSEWSALLDAEDILTAYAGVELSGGAGGEVDLAWAESLGTGAVLSNNNFLMEKGHRDEVEGKCFYGFGDTFIPAGGAGRVQLSAPWWRAGRYLLVRVRTAGEPLLLERILCTRTYYPLVAQGRFSSNGDASLPEVLALCERGIRASCHEIYADCPAFEQLMYAGDCRVEMLIHRVLSTDARLARKAVQLFNDSRHRGQGWTWSRYPARMGQIIPGFSLIWVLMVDDFRLWRGDLDFVRTQLPGVRALLDLLESYLDGEGWLRCLPGWQFIDWCPQWQNGVPPTDNTGRSAPINLLYILALKAGVRIERALGSDLRAAHLSQVAGRVEAALRAGCWDERAGLFSDVPGRSVFSEHTQVLAVLAVLATKRKKRALMEATRAMPAGSITPVSYYFAHYLFEACHEAGCDWLHDRLTPWRELLAKGLRTPIESPEPSRSDCHGWSAHPLFHAFATVAGIRPAASGFARVMIEPLPGPLTTLLAVLPWQSEDAGDGLIKVALEFSGSRVSGSITLPLGLAGEFLWQGTNRSLIGGNNIL